MITYTIGDTRDVIATIPDGSVSLIATSPPFIQLRSYLPADHPDKHAEIGSEPDPATFIDTMLELTAEWGRVLAPWGSIAIELGDTFAGSGGAGGDYNDGGLRKGQPQFDGSTKYLRTHDPAIGPPISRVSGTAGGGGGAGWPRAKCLALVPQAYALSLAYGRNVLTGQPSPAGQWLVRNVITWHRPNPAVGALGDKYRPSTSQIVVATRSAKRWFDLTAVRTAAQDQTQRNTNGPQSLAQRHEMPGFDVRVNANPAGAPPLDAWFDEYDGTTDTWTLTTQPSKLAHYAMWPAKLAERLILSMCPAEVCTSCGEPRRRVEKVTGLVDQRGRQVPRVNWPSGMDHVDETGKRTHIVAGQLGGALGAMSLKTTGGTTTTTTIGWTSCPCDAPFTPGTVLDPFAGTGTTLAVADLHGRDAIGIDIDARNPQLYEQRRAECARNLFDSPMPDPNQLDLFGGAA